MVGRIVVGWVLVGLVGLVVGLPAPTRGTDGCAVVGVTCCDSGVVFFCDQPDLACNLTSHLCEKCGDLGQLCCPPFFDSSGPGSDPAADLCNGGLSCNASGRCSGTAAPALSHAGLAVTALLLIGSGMWLVRRRRSAA